MNDQNPAEDVASIARIESIPKMLEVACKMTGLGFCAVARVTRTRWIACAVRDDLSFGVQVGQEMSIEETMCNEVRPNGQLVVIDHVERDAKFCRHPLPTRYGFQSYIAVPIVLKNGQCFGTLSALDRGPARLNNKHVIGMFQLFAELIAANLDCENASPAAS